MIVTSDAIAVPVTDPLVAALNDVSLLRRTRYYSPTTGRFNRLDPFAGNAAEPQTLHKYLYTHADPINSVDPSGLMEFTLTGLLTVASVAALIGTAGIYARNPSAWWVDAGEFVPVTYAKLQVHYHSVRIRGSTMSADQLFIEMTRFSDLNVYPTRASGNIAGVGGVVMWDMSPWFLEVGQGDFGVKVTQYDFMERFFVVRTLAGHPLAGWRRWQVHQLPGGDILIDTFSVEHEYAFFDLAKTSLDNNKGMYTVWTNMLEDLVGRSQGTIVEGADTVLQGEQRFIIDRYYSLVAP